MLQIINKVKKFMFNISPLHKSLLLLCNNIYYKDNINS